jgi:LysR family transcriptional regulator, low CO2-responsive transcriptional regulator
MDFEQLVAFDRVAREGSFSRAALAVGIGQPAMSARIAALEAAVGGPLLTRGRPLALTALGEGFLPWARRLLETRDEGIEAARLAQQGRRGRVRMGVLGSLAGGLLGPALAELIRGRPELECAIGSADHEALAERVLGGAYELALIAWPCPEALAGSLSALVVLREPVVLVAHPRHPVARRAQISPEALARDARPLLRVRWWPAHDPAVTRLAQLSGTYVDVPIETARHLARHGVGAGFFTRTYVAEDLARGELKEVRVHAFPTLWRESAVVRRARSTPLSPAAAYAVELIRRQARRLGLAVPAPAGGERPRPATATSRRGPRRA